MLPCFHVALGLSRFAPFTHGIQFVLAQVTLDRSPGFVLGALFSQLASRADFLGSWIITAFAVLMQRLALEQLPRRAAAHIDLRIIKKLIMKNRDDLFIKKNRDRFIYY